MKLSVATSLIERGIDELTPYQNWADLGAGDGLFTRALGHLIGDEGIIYAIDKDPYVLKEIDTNHQPASIIPMAGDFVSGDIGLSHLHGILMANSLHFVENKTSLLAKVKALLQPCGRMVIVEYNTAQSTQWVPFPIPFTELEKLMTGVGFVSVQQLSEQPSRYGAGSIYSALVQSC